VYERPVPIRTYLVRGAVPRQVRKESKGPERT
jgi:hypothetical protein